MTKSSHSHSKLKKGGSDEKLRKVRGVRPRQREIQNADIHQAWTLCQVHLAIIPRSSWSFRSFHKSDEYQYLEKYILWNTSSSQENCHSIHWHCGWVSYHQVATLAQLFARNGLHLLPVQGWQHCGCGQCYPHTLRHLWRRRPASLVSLSKFSCFSTFFITTIMHLYFRFDCADYMREPSDIAVGGREFYVCDFKVMSLTIVQSSTSFLNFTMFFNIITLAGPQCCCFHRGRSLRKTNWVRIDSKMSASEKTLIPTIRSGKFFTSDR